MTRQIIQHLLEHQDFVSSERLSNCFKQPLSIINREILELNRKYPELLTIQENRDSITVHFYVKIAANGDAIARSLLQ